MASVEASRTEKDYNRYKQLFDANAGITQQQVDNASAAAQFGAGTVRIGQQPDCRRPGESRPGESRGRAGRIESFIYEDNRSAGGPGYEKIG